MDRKTQFLIALDEAIQCQRHSQNNNNWEEFGSCFQYHIFTANNAITIPFNPLDMSRMTCSLIRFTKEIMLNRDKNRPLCVELSELINLIPDDSILEYEE